MATSLVPKVLFGILGAGVAGGTVVTGYRVFKGDYKKEEIPKTNKESKGLPTPVEKKLISDLIKEKSGKTLLTKSLGGSNNDWKKAYEKYRVGESSKDANPWNISNWDNKKTQANQDAPDDFMDVCVNESKKMVSGVEDLEYRNVLDWCTKDSSEV